VFIDRWDRKKVMIYSDVFIAICSFAMTFLLKDSVSLAWVYVLLGCRSVGNAFHTPAMRAIAPLMVPEDKLLRVSGINQMLHSVTSIGGPALGTLAITFVPISDVLYLDVFGAATAVISLLFVTIPRLKTEKHSTTAGVVADLKDGLGAIHFNKGLRLMYLYAMVATFFIMPVSVMFPLLTTDHYSGGKWQMSIIEIVWGVGMLAGGSLLGLKRIKTSKVVLVNAMYVVLGVTFVLSGGFPASWFIGFVLMTTLGGMSMSVFSAAFIATIQEEVASQMLGRVFSLYYSMVLLPSMIGLLFTGVIAELIGVANAFLISGGAVLMVGLASFLTRPIMLLGRNAGKQKG
jgi:DHA3 family macrolide efflux protein-like MFS transporter